MSDRLPEPLADVSPPTASARASATPQHVAAPSLNADRPGVLPPAHSQPGSLSELQSWLVAAICGPSLPPTAAIVRDGPQLSGAGCVAIYRSGYVLRLTECLRDDYPVLAQTLGEVRFAKLCRQYIARFPSASASLNAFGKHMSDLCRGEPLEHAVFLAELATLEWTLVEVTHARAPAALDSARLEAVPPEAWSDARLIVNDSLRVLSFSHSVNAYYQACRTRDEPVPLPAAVVSSTAVYRKGTRLWRMDLTPAMTRVLAALMAGDKIAHALAAMGLDDRDPSALAEAERSVGVWFRAWVEAGFFTDVRLARQGETTRV
jgi:hypothetical protein